MLQGHKSGQGKQKARDHLIRVEILVKEIRVNLLLYFVMSLYQTPPKKRVNSSEHNRTTKKAGGTSAV